MKSDIMNTRNQKVEFYFEFASPYAYLSSEAIEGLCQSVGVELVWKPIMLGPILRRTGARPLYLDGIRGEYAQMDCERLAGRAGIPFRHWPPEPVNSLKAARAALSLTLENPGKSSRDPAAFIHGCFRAHFADGRDLFDDDVLLEIAAGLEMDGEALLSVTRDPHLKQRLMDETEAAYQRGVFGSPTFFFGGEMLWGNDRLPLLAELIREHQAGEKNP